KSIHPLSALFRRARPPARPASTCPRRSGARILRAFNKFPVVATSGKRLATTCLMMSLTLSSAAAALSPDYYFQLKRPGNATLNHYITPYSHIIACFILGLQPSQVLESVCCHWIYF